MKYAKPEITQLGSPATAVRGFGKIHQSNPDMQTANLQPSLYRDTVAAYEADE
jgi:hypothetical protein